ncbi:Gfo/Idh/MocA family protein [Paenibacillus sp. y28]|uniref:Gfo/Idh/MocA family protein n=1 Tax=Paenibacillus sp. y28 TaxID=3129110 RepID=UPI00301A447D
MDNGATGTKTTAVQTLRIGMIGAGGIAKARHLPGLQQLDGIEFTAVANRSLANAQAAAEQYGFKRVYARWQDVVEDEEVNTVFICTPPYLHSEITRYALARGKHVFCQARMAMNLADAHTMLEADQASPLTTMLCPPPHYMLVEQKVLSLLAEGALGQVRHIVLDHPAAQFLDAAQPLHWRQRESLQGMNMLDVGIMAETLMKWFGPVTELSARARTWTTERPLPEGGGSGKVDLPDSVTVLAEFDSGATLTALFTGAVRGGKPHLTIHGSAGTLTCFSGEAYLTLDTGSGPQPIELQPSECTAWTVERDFVEAVRSGRKGYPSFVEGVRYMSFTQAVADSIAGGGQPVTLQRSGS